jgi:type II secretory pathway component PulC
MLNFKNTKKILLVVLVMPSIYLLGMLALSILSTPEIKIISSINLKDINTSNSFNESPTEISDTTINTTFEYKLIGIRSGEINSSVIVKKANKQYVVALGDKLDDIYVLIEVNQNDAVFRNGQKIYKLEYNIKGN